MGLPKIWIETLARLDALEERVDLIDEIAQEPLKELKARKSLISPEPEPEPESKPKQE